MLAESKAVVAAWAVNNTAFAPGRTCGQRWVSSPAASSVNATGEPPVAGIRASTPIRLSSAMMLPSSPQLPPRPLGAEDNAMAAPPSTEILLSLLLLKKPTHCPSGEKKGAEAPSVPASSVALGCSSLRVKSFPLTAALVEWCLQENLRLPRS